MAATIKSELRIPSLRSPRRLVAPSLGEIAWYNVWENLNFRQDEMLSSERAELLQQKVVIALRGLETRDYNSFCFKAHEYCRDHLTGAVIFSDLPDLANFTMKYNPAAREQIERLRSSRGLEDRLPWIVGAVGFVAGAIGGGALIDNEYVRHATESAPLAAVYVGRIGSAIGGIAGGLTGLLGSALLVENYTRSIFDCQKKIEQKATSEFIIAVQQYLQHHA